MDSLKLIHIGIIGLGFGITGHNTTLNFTDLQLAVPLCKEIKGASLVYVLTYSTDSESIKT